jgi:hypothetical protein
MKIATGIFLSGILLLSAMLMGAVHMETEGVEEAPAESYDWWTACGVDPMYYECPRTSIVTATWYVDYAMVGCPRHDAKLISANEGLSNALNDENWDMYDPDMGSDSGMVLEDKPGPSVYRAITSAIRGIEATAGKPDASQYTVYYCEKAESELVIAAWAMADILMDKGDQYADLDPYIYDKLEQAADAEATAYNFYMEGNTIKTIHFLKNSWNYAGLAYWKGVELFCVDAYEESLNYVDLGMVEVDNAEPYAEADDWTNAIYYLSLAKSLFESAHDALKSIFLDYYWPYYYRQVENSINGLLSCAYLFPFLKDYYYGLIVQLKFSLAEMLLGHDFGTFPVTISYNGSMDDPAPPGENCGVTTATDTDSDGDFDQADIEIGPDAFDGPNDDGFSEPWLLSTILHEREPGDDANDQAANEMEAYDTEKRNAGRTGLSRTERQWVDNERDGWQNTLPEDDRDDYDDDDNDGTMNVNEDWNPFNNNPNYTYPP